MAVLGRARESNVGCPFCVLEKPANDRDDTDEGEAIRRTRLRRGPSDGHNERRR